MSEIASLLGAQLDILLMIYDNPLTPISSLLNQEREVAKVLINKNLVRGNPSGNILLLSITDKGRAIARTILENREAEKYNASFY